MNGESVVNFTCNGDCDMCRPVPVEIYLAMTDEEKDNEMEKAGCRVRKKLIPYLLDLNDEED